MKKASLNIQTMSVEDLVKTKADYNPRVISEGAMYGLKTSIDHFGYVESIVYNKRTNTLVSGHQRLTVLESEGYKEVDVNVIDIPLEDEKALNVMMNNEAIQGDFNKDVFELLDEIELTNPELYDLTLMKEIEMMFQSTEEDEMEQEDEKPKTDPLLEKQMEAMAYEHYDCILVVCKRLDDWLYLSSALGLDKKVIISSPSVKTKKLGKSRAIDASVLTKAMMKERGEDEDS